MTKNIDHGMESPEGADTIKIRVERTLGELMRVEVHLDQNDPRIISIQEDICRKHNGKVSSVSNEEITGYVKKYYRFKAVVERT